MNELDEEERRTGMKSNKSGLKKEAILGKSLELISRYGLKKISIRDIAKAAGTSQVTIYNNFENKEALFCEIIMRLLNRLEAERVRILQCELPFDKRLEQVLQLRKEMIDKDQWDVITDAINEFPDIKEYVSNVYIPAYRKHLLEFIDDGKQQGYINPELSEEAILTYIDIFQNFYMDKNNVTKNRTSDDKLIQDLWTLFWNGLS